MFRDYRLELRILTYLQKHQQAGDTLEGIATWWLTTERIDESVIRVKRSLDNLKLKGVVSENKLPDGKLHYALNELYQVESNGKAGTVIAFPGSKLTGVNPNPDIDADTLQASRIFF